MAWKEMSRLALGAEARPRRDYRQNLLPEMQDDILQRDLNIRTGHAPPHQNPLSAKQGFLGRKGGRGRRLGVGLTKQQIRAAEYRNDAYYRANH